MRIHSTSHDQQQPHNSSAAGGGSSTSAGSQEVEVDNSIDRIIDSQDNGVCSLIDDHFDP